MDHLTCLLAYLISLHPRSNNISAATYYDNCTMLIQASKEHEVDPLIVLTIAHNESKFSRKAKNPKSSAKGLLGVVNYINNSFCDYPGCPRYIAGIKYLKYLKKYDEEQALCFYAYGLGDCNILKVKNKLKKINRLRYFLSNI